MLCSISRGLNRCALQPPSSCPRIIRQISSSKRPPAAPRQQLRQQIVPQRGEGTGFTPIVVGFAHKEERRRGEMPQQLAVCQATPLPACRLLRGERLDTLPPSACWPEYSNTSA